MTGLKAQWKVDLKATHSHSRGSLWDLLCLSFAWAWLKLSRQELQALICSTRNVETSGQNCHDVPQYTAHSYLGNVRASKLELYFYRWMNRCYETLGASQTWGPGEPLPMPGTEAVLWQTAWVPSPLAQLHGSCWPSSHDPMYPLHCQMSLRCPAPPTPDCSHRSEFRKQPAQVAGESWRRDKAAAPWYIYAVGIQEIPARCGRLGCCLEAFG